MSGTLASQRGPAKNNAAREFLRGNALRAPLADAPDPHSSGRRAYFATKRVFDVTLVMLAAPAALLIVALAAVALWSAVGRPIFFRQDRIGMGGRTFRIVKLRTMTTRGAADGTATVSNDGRITPLGGTLRRYRIDELPQLLNVLKGDMSLIGPRPEQPHLCELYRKVVPHFDERHSVRPGLTGLAQVMYGYAATIEETRIKVRYDRFYVARASLSLDVMILVKTVTTVLLGRGAR